MSGFLARQNMIERKGEDWRPPLLASPDTALRLRRSSLRRWFDLQTGSIWRDLAVILGNAQGFVVDVGCGAQPYRRLLPAHVKYTGIDTIDAKEHFGYEIPDTIYFEGTTWPLADASVDLLLITEALEHVYHVRPFLAEAQRTLIAGGLLVATVPFAARWHFIPHDYWRFTPSCLSRLLEESGFGHVEVYARGSPVTVACYKTMALILPWLMPSSGRFLGRIIKRMLGLLASPIVLLCAVVGNLSLYGSGGDDCLGYTLIARKQLES